MFPDVVVCPGLLIHVVGLKAGIRHVFLVNTPADAAGLEKVNYGLRPGG